MIGTDVFLVPDTGDSFLCCLKTAVMFSERVCCIGALAPEVVNHAVENGRQLGPQSRQFLDACAQHESDFALLRREGIIPGADDSPKVEVPYVNSDSFLEGMIIRSIFHDKVIHKLVRSNKLPADALELCGRNAAMRTCPPSCWHLLQETYSKHFQGTKEMRDLLKPEVFDRLMFDIYLKTLVDIADHFGAVIMSYSRSFEDSIRKIRNVPSMFAENASEADVKAISEQARLQWAANKLAHTLLSRDLPRVHDLPMEEVLELRRKHRDQIAAFRIGLGEVAAQIDETRAPEQDWVQINRLILAHVDPALADLRAAIKNSRIDALKRLGQSWQTLAAASIGAAVTYTMTGGTQIALTGLAGVLTPMIGAFVSGHLEKRKLMNASRWSLLISIDEGRKN
jgi:hypothetical protein